MGLAESSLIFLQFWWGRTKTLLAIMLLTADAFFPFEFVETRQDLLVDFGCCCRILSWACLLQVVARRKYQHFWSQVGA